METQAHEFIKAGRFDRFDTLSRSEFDLWQVTAPKLCEAAEQVAHEANVESKYNSRCLGVDDAGGLRLYSFEVWGELAEHWAQACSPVEWNKLQRLDYRIACELDPRNFAGFANYVGNSGKYGRNINTFKTREREKSEGRHAGGQGVSVGSHKSDRRLVVYKRKGESGAIELQLSGATLRKLVAAAREAVAQQLEPSMYHAMRSYCVAAIEKMAKECGFESAHALVRSLMGPSTDYSPPPDFVAEAPVQMLLQGFGQLSREEQDEFAGQMLSSMAQRSR